jgi:hypothetical protein
VISAGKENREILLVVSMDVGVKGNAGKCRKMCRFCPENTKYMNNRKTSKKSFEIVAKLRHLAAKLTDRNPIYEESERKFISGNACYNSIQIFPPFCLHFKNFNIEMCGKKILPPTLNGCQTWSFRLRVK